MRPTTIRCKQTLPIKELKEVEEASPYFDDKGSPAKPNLDDSGHCLNTNGILGTDRDMDLKVKIFDLPNFESDVLFH